MESPVDLDRPPNVGGDCRKCGAKTVKHCQRCFEGINRADHKTTTYYCSAECQKTDWPTHKLECKHIRDRKQLYRAGRLARVAFAVYREQMFDFLINKIEKRGNDIHIWEGKYEENQLLASFPAGDLSGADQEAILTHDACSDALTFMHDLIEKSLEGICTHICEFQIRAKGERRQIVIHDLNGELCDISRCHELLQVTLKDGSAYAFDITSAQFGHEESVVPWDQYVQERVAQIVAIPEFGHRNQEQRKEMAKLTVGQSYELTSLAAIYALNSEAIQWFNEASRHWLSREGLTMPELLNLPNKAWPEMAESYLAFVNGGLDAFKECREKALLKQRTESTCLNDGLRMEVISLGKSEVGEEAVAR